MKSDEIAVVEAAYRLDGRDEDWLMDLARAAEPLLDRGLGLLAWTFGPTPDGHVGVRNHLGTGDPRFIAELRDAHGGHDRADITRLHLAGPCHSMQEVLGAERAFADARVQDVTRRWGVADIVGIMSADAAGQGIGLSVPVRRFEPTRPAFRRRWSRLAVHWTAAYRARRAVAALSPTAVMDTADAVLTPDGDVAHATADARRPAAREALRRAACAVDRARGRLRSSDVDTALELWRGLFAGRWSLIDVFDVDGRRFVVARRNDPAVPARGGLTARELQILAYRAQGHPLKLIAYECGLSVGTVSGYLHAACTKLGVRTPLEIARLFGAPV